VPRCAIALLSEGRLNTRWESYLWNLQCTRYTHPVNIKSNKESRWEGVGRGWGGAEERASPHRRATVYVNLTRLQTAGHKECPILSLYFCSFHRINIVVFLEFIRDPITLSLPVAGEAARCDSGRTAATDATTDATGSRVNHAAPAPANTSGARRVDEVAEVVEPDAAQRTLYISKVVFCHLQPFTSGWRSSWAQHEAHNMACNMT